jgi:hypothetical protein
MTLWTYTTLTGAAPAPGKRAGVRRIPMWRDEKERRVPRDAHGVRLTWGRSPATGRDTAYPSSFARPPDPRGLPCSGLLVRFVDLTHGGGSSRTPCSSGKPS